MNFSLISSALLLFIAFPIAGTWAQSNLSIPANDQLLVVGALGKKGILNPKGDTITPCIWKDITAGNTGMFIVTAADNRTGLMDVNGRFIIPLSPCVLWRVNGAEGDAYAQRCGDQNSFADKLYDPKGNLIPLPEIRITGISYNRDLPPLPESECRYYFNTLLQENGLRYVFSADGRQLLPNAYSMLTYYSEKHPLIAQLNGKNWRENRSFVFDLNGTNLLPEGRQYDRLAHTVNPRILHGIDANSRRYGFIDLDHPEKEGFIYANLRPMLNGYFVGYLGRKLVLLDVGGQRVTEELFSFIDNPEPGHLQQFKSTGRGKLIAVVRRPDTPESAWIGLNEKAEAFYFDRLPPEIETTPVEILQETPPSAKHE